MKTSWNNDPNPLQDLKDIRAVLEAPRPAYDLPTAHILSQAAQPAIMKEIVRRRLLAIEDEKKVHVLYACESGSRAWGFESPDSDYDVRFIYHHPQDWYLSIAENRRDVIEHMIPNPKLDLVGWELRKALRLFAKSNPPLLEWLQSPTVYLEDLAFTDKLRGLLLLYYSPRACSYHYLHMAKGNYNRYLHPSQAKVSLKKYLYVVRPLLAVLWIERGVGPMPMQLGRLLQALGSDLPPGLEQAIRGLVILKMRGEELQEVPPIFVIDKFIQKELARQEARLRLQPRPELSNHNVLDRLFRTTICTHNMAQSPDETCDQGPNEARKGAE